MRFLIDESTGPQVARWLHEIGHDVYSIHEEMPGSSDKGVRQTFYCVLKNLETSSL